MAPNALLNIAIPATLLVYSETSRAITKYSEKKNRHMQVSNWLSAD
jgi:hypothetical protein